MKSVLLLDIWIIWVLFRSKPLRLEHFVVLSKFFSNVDLLVLHFYNDILHVLYFSIRLGKWDALQLFRIIYKTV